MNKFYTYMYTRRDGTPYYVGKANDRKRAFSKLHNATPPEKSRIFIQRWASEEEALSIEKWYISLFGRKDIGTGVLRNLTDGGEIGPTGSKHSEESKKKVSVALTGIVRSPDTRARMSLAKTGLTHTEESKQKIRDKKTGIKQTPEMVAKRTAGRAGYRHSEETIRKIAETNRATYAKKQAAHA